VIVGHDGDFNLKSDLIATVDKYFVGELSRRISLDDHIVCITADHSTPCLLKSHSDDPVPILIAASKLQRDKVQSFSEKECKFGEVGVLSQGTELIPKLVKYMRQ